MIYAPRLDAPPGIVSPMLGLNELIFGKLPTPLLRMVHSQRSISKLNPRVTAATLHGLYKRQKQYVAIW